MSMLMHDATTMVSPACGEALRSRSLFDLLYADDTLIVGSDAKFVQEYAAAVEAAGATYGLSLHWGKTQYLAVDTAPCLIRPDGSPYEDTAFLHCLGGLISRDGRVDSEISRKIGMAHGDFKVLQRLWGHAGVTTKKKIEYFTAFVASRLLYGLPSVWLVTSQRRRLDGFYCRCLRRILGIQSSYMSRVSNATVLSQAGMKPFSAQVLKQQLLLLGRAALAPDGSPMRCNTFADGTLIPQIGRFIRKVGRPRQDWTSQLMLVAEGRLGIRRLQTLLADRSEGSLLRWRREVERLF